MITNISGKFFRKHLDVSINLTPGVNAFRAPNESGKSTIIEMLTYAFFGAKGLKDPLEQVVTIGTPVNKLSVQVDCTFNGVEYKVKRSAAGAELTFASEVVTGQTAVTKFFEGLLGASADLAFKLMIAEQTSLRGALTEGAAAAGKLIEELANFDLIDTIIDLIQAELLCGVTTALEARLADAQARAAVAAEKIDLAPLTATLAEAKSQEEAAVLAWNTAKVDLLGADVVQNAQQAIARHTEKTKALAAAELQLANIVTVDLPENVSDERLEQLRQQKTAAADVAKLRALKAKLEKLDLTPQWEGDAASLDAEIATAKAGKSSTEIALATAKTAKVRFEGKLIKETTCVFCDKNLADVPEVAQINSQYAKDIAAQEVEIAKQSASLADQVDYLRSLEEVKKAGTVAELALASAAEHITIDRSNVPATYTWTTEIVEASDVSADLEAALSQRQKYEQAVVRKRTAETVATSAQVQIATLQKELAAMQAPSYLQELLDGQLAARAVADACNEKYVAAKANSASAAAKLATAEALNAAGEKDAAQARETVNTLEAELKETRENNSLIKKIKAARPKVSDKLWSMVLAAVSTYFTQVRGFDSVVTREDNKFKVNGVAIGEGGLSGSAKDALGLAIRMSLVKMFLPNTSFLVLDELAAACDDQREIAMLGLVSTAGFEQVILVTHSNLCESYADNIITL